MDLDNYSNKTIYGIQNDAVKYTWIAYFLFVIVSSLIGDTLILVASIKYRSIKLHSFIVACIQHIAVCDLMVSITTVLPKMVSLFAGGWVLGKVPCAIGPFIMIYPITVSLLLICLMTTSKLFVLKFPTKSNSLTSKRGHMACASVWFFATNIPVILFLVDKNDIYFDYRVYNCQYGFSSDMWTWLRILLSLLNFIIPNLLVIASTVPLMLYLLRARTVARRSRGAMRWQGILTTVITAAVYSISALPYAVYQLRENGSKDPNGFYLRLTSSLLFLNTVSNFYICLFTVPSFRLFVRTNMQTYTSDLSSIKIGAQHGMYWLLWIE